MREEAPGSRLEQANDKVRGVWAKRADKYEKSMSFYERRLFGTEHRPWACSRATGETLEVAVGTGLNLPLYPSGVRLTGIDLSPDMLAIARARAADLALEVMLQEGDAHDLPFPDESFDAIICTYSLCGIPDPHLAVGEMKRVLRPGAKLVLVDHIASSVKPVLWAQKAIEYFTTRIEGEHMTRRPLEQVKAHGLNVTERERLGPAAVVERLVATKE